MVRTRNKAILLKPWNFVHYWMGGWEVWRSQAQQDFFFNRYRRRQKMRCFSKSQTFSKLDGWEFERWCECDKGSKRFTWISYPNLDKAMERDCFRVFGPCKESITCLEEEKAEIVSALAWPGIDIWPRFWKFWT